MNPCSLWINIALHFCGSKWSYSFIVVPGVDFKIAQSQRYFTWRLKLLTIFTPYFVLEADNLMESPTLSSEKKLLSLALMTLSCQQSQYFWTIYSMLWLSLYQLFWDEGEIVSKTCRLLKMAYVNVHILMALTMAYYVQEDNKEMPITMFQTFCWICQQKQLIFPRRVLFKGLAEN